MSISRKIKEHRTKAGLSQNKLAKMIGCSRMNIINWEKGMYLPRMNHYKKLNKVFNTEL